jgi:hypothetical protein
MTLWVRVCICACLHSCLHSCLLCAPPSQSSAALRNALRRCFVQQCYTPALILIIIDISTTTTTTTFFPSPLPGGFAPPGFKFWRFDVRLTLGDAPGSLNYLVGLVGGQAPLASHSIHLPARCVGGCLNV